MDKSKEHLEEENRRLKKAVAQINEHLSEIITILESIRDLTDSDHEKHEKVEETEVMSLLKKYSNIG